MPRNEDVKICVACGRPFANRKKWRRRGQWDQVIYCSQRCQKSGKRTGPRPVT